MEYNPSLHKRLTKELLNIISNDKKWIKEIQELASEELLKRGFNKEALIKERIKRLEVIERYSEREKNRTQRNRKESYTLFEACLIILFFPFSLFKLGGLLNEFLRLDKYNYKKKIWQRLILVILSIILWIQVLRLFL